VLSSDSRDLSTSRDQRHSQRFDVVWQSFKAIAHDPDGIIKRVI
jgi:hypothetical protein